MKHLTTESTLPIPILQDLGTGRYYFHYNHSQYVTDGQTMYKADTILFQSRPDVEEIENELGRKLTEEEIYEVKKRS